MKLTFICICVSFVILQQSEACLEVIEKALGLEPCHKVRHVEPIRKPPRVVHRPEREGQGDRGRRPGEVGPVHRPKPEFSGGKRHEGGKPCKGGDIGNGKGKKGEHKGNGCHEPSPKPKPKPRPRPIPKPIPMPCHPPHPRPPCGCPSSKKPTTTERPETSTESSTSSPICPSTTPSVPTCPTPPPETTTNSPCGCSNPGGPIGSTTPGYNPGGPIITTPVPEYSTPSPCGCGSEPGWNPYEPHIPTGPEWGCGYGNEPPEWYPGPWYPLPYPLPPELPYEPIEPEPWNPNYPTIPPYESLCPALQEEYDRIRPLIAHCACRPRL